MPANPVFSFTTDLYHSNPAHPVLHQHTQHSRPWRPCGPHLSSSSSCAPTAALHRNQPAHCTARRDLTARPTALSSSASNAAAAGTAGPGEEEVVDRSIQVKIWMAESSGKLDLSECDLTSVPPAVFELAELEDLSLAGNRLQALPEDLGRLTGLKRLQLAGNCLQVLPESVGQLGQLEGLWLHGNQLQALPDSITQLSALTQLSLAGNRLQVLPENVGALSALQELSLAGNLLRALPASLGQLAALTKLSLQGNELEELPSSVSGMQALQELWMQGNLHLTGLPAELGWLPHLKHLSAADCALEGVPAELACLPELQSLTLYGNQLQEVPPSIMQAPQLRHVWLESNPLHSAATHALLEAAVSALSVSCLGLDLSQLKGAPPAAINAAAGRLRPCEVHGSGRGYFKLELAHWPQHAVAGTQQGPLENGGSSSGMPRARVLVVSFGSAPGTPNWGGVLAKLRKAAASPEEGDFDVCYVVDPQRAWYQGGEDGYHKYEQRLASLTAQYKHVVFIGDSMGATAALLFAHLATSVQAFCPQICLDSASIRPGQPQAWFDTLRGRILENVGRSSAAMRVHCGNWSHDLDQARLLPQERVDVKIYSADTHRLALLLDRRGKLEGVIRGAVLQELGLPTGQIRLANLL